MQRSFTSLLLIFNLILFVTACSKVKPYYDKPISKNAGSLICSYFSSAHSGYSPSPSIPLGTLIFNSLTYNPSRKFITSSTEKCNGEIKSGCGLIFYDLNTEAPKLKGNVNSLSTLSLVRKLGDEILLLEETVLGGFILHRIDYKTGSIITTKNINGFGAPYGWISVGQCSE